MSLYYKIWVDGIVKVKSRPDNSGLWKFALMNFTSMSMALNLLLLQFILNDLGIMDNILSINVDLFPGTRLDAIASFFLVYLLPFLLLNYFLIFYRDRYKTLIKRYPSHDGKWYVRYFLGSLLGFIGYIWTAVIITKFL